MLQTRLPCEQVSDYLRKTGLNNGRNQCWSGAPAYALSGKSARQRKQQEEPAGANNATGRRILESSRWVPGPGQIPLRGGRVDEPSDDRPVSTYLAVTDELMCLKACVTLFIAPVANLAGASGEHTIQRLPLARGPTYKWACPGAFHRCTAACLVAGQSAALCYEVF